MGISAGEEGVRNGKSGLCLNMALSGNYNVAIETEQILSRKPFPEMNSNNTYSRLYFWGEGSRDKSGNR